MILQAKGQVSTRLGNGPWTPFRDNLVVTSGGAALAAGLAALDGKSNAMFHALGVGRFQWDAVLPNPAKDDAALVDEYFRAAPSNITHILETEGLHEPTSPTPSNQLRSTLFATIAPANFLGRLIEIIAGPGTGDIRQITGYTPSETITLDSNLSATPDATTRWRLGSVSSSPTGVIDVETTFPATEGNSDGQIREQGLFLGAATAELGTGTMLSIIRHPVITKSGQDLTQVWRLRIEVV